MELILAADACKEYGANEVIALIPYMAYSRQDKAFLEGEVVSIRAVLKSLRSAGIETLITVDIHKEESLRYFDGKAINVEPWQVFANVLGSDVKEDALVIAPDKGAEKRAATLAREIGVNYVVFSKYRDRITGEIRHEYKDIKLEGKHVIIVDDIISTGGTVADIAKFVSERGAKKVYAVASHGLFVRNAVRRLRESRVDEVYVLNTVPQKENVKVLDVSPAVVNVLKELI
jgi:ribose-phosphate pyrophosphokinase